MEPGFNLLRLNQTRRVTLGVLGIVSISAGIALVILTLHHPELIALQLTTGIVFSLTLSRSLQQSASSDSASSQSLKSRLPSAVVYV